jgi:hypothetical protein
VLLTVSPYITLVYYTTRMANLKTKCVSWKIYLFFSVVRNYNTRKIISCSINNLIEIELPVALHFKFAGLHVYQLKIFGMKEMIYVTSKTATI